MNTARTNLRSGSFSSQALPQLRRLPCLLAVGGYDPPRQLERNQWHDELDDNTVAATSPQS
jgi:hypothetical protein